MSDDSKIIIKHEWVQLIVLVVTVASLFLWSRSESKSDYRHLEASVNANLIAIREEMKDFHGRLCAIEVERNKK